MLREAFKKMRGSMYPGSTPASDGLNEIARGILHEVATLPDSAVHPSATSNEIIPNQPPIIPPLETPERS